MLNRPVVNSASARLAKSFPCDRSSMAKDWPGRSVSVGYEELSHSTWLPESPRSWRLPESLSATTDPRVMRADGALHSTWLLPSVSVSLPSAAMLRVDCAVATGGGPEVEFLANHTTDCGWEEELPSPKRNHVARKNLFGSESSGRKPKAKSPDGLVM
uniref:Uncharacterized protein n=1 Tax=Arundo donax TaxID=35708 RepID=A0A0A9ATY0_ARUDO